MLDALIIDNISSLDFDASVSEREISFPEKKTIKETIPYSNITYDFSRIEGEQFYEERELEYELEIIADNPLQLEEKKQKLSSWLSEVFRAELHDPFIRNYHFLATTEEIEFDDEEDIEKTTVKIKFKAYPYKIKNNETVVSKEYTTEIKIVTIENLSDHPIIPHVECTTPAIITINNLTFTIPTGVVKTSHFKLKKGMNEFQIKASEQPGTMTIRFREEVI